MARMSRQQQLDASLLRTFTRILVVLLMSALVAAGIQRMLSNTRAFYHETLQQESLRLKQVIQVLRHQWLIKGKPGRLQVKWSRLSEDSAAVISADENAAATLIEFNLQGYPALTTADDQGCERLWQSLTAADTELLKVKAQYEKQDQACRFHQRSANNRPRATAEIRYQPQTGIVAYLPVIKSKKLVRFTETKIAGRTS